MMFEYSNSHDIFKTHIIQRLQQQLGANLYANTQLHCVPELQFDLCCPTKSSGLVLFWLRETLPQGIANIDLEAVYVKYVYPKAKCFLVTIDKEEATRLERKRVNGDLLGIDDIVLGNEASFDDMVQFLASLKLEQPAPVEIMSAFKVLHA